MPVAYRNAHSGRVVERDQPDPQLEAARKWVRCEADLEEQSPSEAPANTDSDPFDPSDHTVGEVNSWLAYADPGERQRVLEAETDGKGRVRILTGPYSDPYGD